MRTVLESAGIHNVLAKSLGTSNANNVIKATFDALSKLRTPFTISGQRGVKMEKIFNG
jgi:small subunit ribosomal protein S5